MIDVATRSLVFVGLVALAFVPLELVFPAHGERRTRFATDLAFATLGRTLTKVLLLLGVGRLVDVADAHAWQHGPWTSIASGPLRTLASLGLGLLLFELGGYVYHRLAHSVPALWRLHAIHHSSETMDWLAAFRQHPLEIVAMTLVQNLPLVLLGIPLSSHALVVVLLELNTVFVHSNVRIPPGPWCALVATPRFHHRHHSREGRPRNFATLFPFLDRLFGTYEDEEGTRFGLPTPIGDGFLRQLVLPFLPRRTAPRPR